MNFDAMLEALQMLISPEHLMFLLMGNALGLLVGLLPGLGGLAGLSMLLPFIYGLDASYALALMIGLLAPISTSDTFPAVLMGIPGSSASQATVVDGFQMTRRGEAARALGAAFTASVLGGLFGAVVLTLAIVFARPLVLAIGFSEQMLLMLIALSLIGMLTGRSALKGIAAAALGLLIGCIGFAPATGEARFTFNETYLLDGVPIVIFGLGLYAVPEIWALLQGRRSISEAPLVVGGLMRGVRDTLRHWWLVLRCSFLGSFFGAIPGLGGSVIDWLTYAHAVQTTRDRSGFGKGDVRGVIAPEAANNAKEGGALVPTLLFGIPGSGSMAVLLGGFVMIGIQPGITMATSDLHLSYLIIWSIALGNIVAVLVCFALVVPIARLTRLPYGAIAPFMIVLVTFAAFQASRSWGDLVALMAFGVLGILLKEYGWSRPAVLVGAFLAPRLEGSVYQTLQVYGWGFLERPSVMVLLLLLALSVAVSLSFRPAAATLRVAPPAGAAGRLAQLTVPALFVGLALAALALTWQLALLGAVFPQIVAGVIIACAGWVGLRIALGRAPAAVFTEAVEGVFTGSGLVRLGWVFALVGLTGLVGLVPATALYVALFLSVWWRRSLLVNLLLGLAAAGLLVALGQAMSLSYPEGLLQSFITYPDWLSGS